MSDRFDFRRGNTLASFAEAQLKCIEYSYLDSTQINLPFDLITGKQQFVKNTENF